MVTTFYPPYHFGGDGIFVYRLAELLARQGHTVDVVHSIDAYRLQHPADPEVDFQHHPNITRHGIETHFPRLTALAAHQLGRPGLFAARLRRVLSGRQYDVIHYHNISLMGGPGVLRYGSALKLYTAHEYWLVCPTHVLFAFNREACTQRHCLACTLHYRRPIQGWRYTGLLKRCSQHVDKFLMPSRFAADRHQSDGLERPMVHLPHFVPMPDAPRSDSPTSTNEELRSRRPYFLYVGRLEKLKGVQDAIEAFREYRSADLLIAGSGTFAAELEKLAAGMPHVMFLGAVHATRLQTLYRDALAVIVPSLCYETFGLTAVEALALGTPVIVRRIGALTEVVDQSGGGLTFSTLPELGAALDRLQTDSTLRQQLGTFGMQAVREHWSPEVHLKRYLELIQELNEARIMPNTTQTQIE